MSDTLLSASDALVETYSYENQTVIAVDLGPAAEPVVDIVDGTAIVVIGDEQREIDVPADAVQAVNSNGIVTFEVSE